MGGSDIYLSIAFNCIDINILQQQSVSNYCPELGGNHYSVAFTLHHVFDYRQLPFL